MSKFFKVSAEDEEKKKKGPGIGTSLAVGALVAGGAAYAFSPDVREFVNKNVSKGVKATSKAKDYAFSRKAFTYGGVTSPLPSRADVLGSKIKSGLGTAAKDTKVQADRLYNKARVEVGKGKAKYLTSKLPADTFQEASSSFKANVYPDWSPDNFKSLVEKAKKKSNKLRILDIQTKQKF